MKAPDNYIANANLCLIKLDIHGLVILVTLYWVTAIIKAISETYVVAMVIDFRTTKTRNT